MCRTVVSALFFVSADFPVRLSFIPSRVLAQVAVFFGAGEVLGGTPAPPQRVEWHFAAQVLWVKPHLRQREEGPAPGRGGSCAKNGRYLLHGDVPPAPGSTLEVEATPAARGVASGPSAGPRATISRLYRAHRPIIWTSSHGWPPERGLRTASVLLWVSEKGR